MPNLNGEGVWMVVGESLFLIMQANLYIQTFVSPCVSGAVGNIPDDLMEVAGALKDFSVRGPQV